MKIKFRRINCAVNKIEALKLLEEIAIRPSHSSPRKVNKPLAIYGAGAFGKMAKEYFDNIGIKIAFIVDENAEKHRSDVFWNNKILLAPNEVSHKEKKDVLLAICVGKIPYLDVVTPLYLSGWLDIVPFYTISAGYRDKHPLGNGWFTDGLSFVDLDGIQEVLMCYDDDISRAHHIQFLAWHHLQEEWSFDKAPIIPDNRYFIPEITRLLHEKEVFLDLGAHHGSVIESFIKIVNQYFREIIAVEPDNANLQKLKLCVASYPLEIRSKIKILPFVIGEECKLLNFYEGLDFASQVCKYGNTQFIAKSIDSLSLKATFIKAHLEGSEMGALLGGIQTVIEFRPLIAMTVYHNRLGLWECSKIMMDEYSKYGYRFLFRLHSWHGSGAVLYLINR
ncbi:MAG: hypothetical protein HQ521_12285 [Bacteroidetes bacterium]|nr:hypothetical protein [Bacteroidota bacterium]